MLGVAGLGGRVWGAGRIGGWVSGKERGKGVLDGIGGVVVMFMG